MLENKAPTRKITHEGRLSGAGARGLGGVGAAHLQTPSLPMLIYHLVGVTREARPGEQGCGDGAGVWGGSRGVGRGQGCGEGAVEEGHPPARAAAEVIRGRGPQI